MTQTIFHPPTYFTSIYTPPALLQGHYMILCWKLFRIFETTSAALFLPTEPVMSSKKAIRFVMYALSLVSHAGCIQSWFCHMPERDFLLDLLHNPPGSEIRVTQPVNPVNPFCPWVWWLAFSSYQETPVCYDLSRLLVSDLTMLFDYFFSPMSH